MDLPDVPCKVEAEDGMDRPDKKDGESGGTPLTDKGPDPVADRTDKGPDPVAEPTASSRAAAPSTTAAASDSVSDQFPTASSPDRDSFAMADSRVSRKKSLQMTLQSGYFGMQGRRPTMEDYHTQLQHPDVNRLASPQSPPNDRVHRSLFAVYDGHGGQWCADYCSKMVQQNLVSHELFREQSATALSDAIVRTDESFCKLVREKGFSDSSGSTAIVVYIVDDQLYVANVGDSRAVLCRAGRCIPLSSDHKPNRKDERARITSLGGYVGRSAPKPNSSRDGPVQKLKQYLPELSVACCSLTAPIAPYRVYPGGLAISRSIGDLEMKATRLVISTPEIKQMTLDVNDEFVIIGCDGIWDVISSEEAVRLVRTYRERHGDRPMEAAKHLATTAYSDGSSDNISVLVIYFKRTDKT